MTWHQYLWPEWQIVDEIGGGAYGTVYKIRREDASGVYFAALKVMTVSINEEVITVATKASNKSEQKLQKETKGKKTLGQTRGFSDIAEKISKEITFMERFKGNSNIVSYEDHRIVFDEESGRWFILLRMELLTSLAEYYKAGEKTEKDVICLGIDICNALSMCEKEGILHRDVKPGNIFVSEFGNYKLGDFGIAFITHNPQTIRDPIGTHDYMAPEVVQKKTYNGTVDLYSLGLIMYRILNKGNAPFLQSDKNLATREMIELADKRRLNGEPLPELRDASEQLGKIILKACSFSPQDRYQSAEIMGNALREYKREIETDERIRKKTCMNRYFEKAGELS